MKADAPLAEGSARDDFGLKFGRSVIRTKTTEGQLFSNSNFPSRPDQALPFVWVLADLVGEQDLDPSAKKVPRGRILRAQRLGTLAAAVAVEAGGEDTSVVEDQEVVGSQEIGEVSKGAIFPGFISSEQVQKAG